MLFSQPLSRVVIRNMHRCLTKPRTTNFIAGACQFSKDYNNESNAKQVVKTNEKVMSTSHKNEKQAKPEPQQRKVFTYVKHRGSRSE
ncbi:hypothetical protein J7T55_010347 [Diaporthe amygdali]|uniref:uncharacterized protein n=1 Tax=Phomopsis amygdali TaxID=1214568 RepID=UPI0022FDC2A8|nr:uncharacterized protein J7T55_010347 [Diaporthe amygdali]KAJ0115525.1 hypothetical protein J7T55_010347 [Diaporthe amygdali]